MVRIGHGQLAGQHRMGRQSGIQIGFKRMREGIESRGCGQSWRQAHHQLGIDDDFFGEVILMENGELLVSDRSR